MLIRLAWRNIWRNKRRTIITATSIMFAVFFALLMRSLQLGSYSNMIENITGAYSGYLQIHKNGYWDEKVINNAMAFDDSVHSALQLKHITEYVPRIESFALASNKNQTRGVQLIGTDPEKEKQLTELHKRIIKGNYLEDRSSVLIAEQLASYMKVDVGDTLVLISQGWHGVSAAGKYPVEGILRFPNPDLNKRVVYLSLNTAEKFFGFDENNMVTSIAIDIDESSQLNAVSHALQKELNMNKYEVMTWREMMVEVVQQIEGDQAGGLIMLGILYLIIGFGVFGTVLMMVAERIREFGVMVSVGMKKFRLITMVFFEMLFIGIFGMISGVVISVPVIIYGYHHPIQLTGETAQVMENYGMEPIMPFAFEPGFFINQAIVVTVLVVLAMLYPLFSLSKMNPVEAIRK